MPRAFSRHRYEMPLLLVFLGLGLVELLVVHLLLSMWSERAAWVLTGLTLLGLVHLALLLRGLVRYPTLIDDEVVVVRHGGRGEIRVPLTLVRMAEDVSFAPEERGPAVLRASLLAQPNVSLRLKEKVTSGRRQIDTISMRLDEPSAFLAELRRRQEAAAG